VCRVPRYALPKGTKHQLSVYGKMAIINGFTKTCVTLSSVSAISEDVLKCKRNRTHEFSHTNECR
jgi:hypothetical protein